MYCWCFIKAVNISISSGFARLREFFLFFWGGGLLTYISLVSVKAVYISICSGFARVRLFLFFGGVVFYFREGNFADIYFTSFYKSCLYIYILRLCQGEVVVFWCVFFFFCGGYCILFGGGEVC